MDHANGRNWRMAEQYLSLMEDIEYRRVESTEDLEEVGRLRARAYQAQKVMNRTGPIIDDIDRHSHAHVFGIYHRERLISTIRLHHVVGEHRYGTAYDLFPDVLNPLLDQGMRFIDPVRHASDPEMLSELPVPFITLRLAAMACEYFEADYCLASIRRAHHAFYRRTFGATQLADARVHPEIRDPNGLFGMRVDTIYGRVASRYPFFRSHPRERRMLFATQAELGVVPLTIRPTAHLVVDGARTEVAA